MATTMVESWSVDLTTLGPIYPWVGSEIVLWIIGLAFWIGWHVWQLRFENRTYQQELLRLNSPDKIERAMRGPAPAIARSPRANRGHIRLATSTRDTVT